MSLIEPNRVLLTDLAGIVGIARYSYAVLFLALLFQTLRYGGSFMLLAVVACILEFVGYSAAFEDYAFANPHLPTAKLLVNMVNYIVIGRLLRASGKDTIFCAISQFVSFLLQFSTVLYIIFQPILSVVMCIGRHGLSLPSDVDIEVPILVIRSIPFASILWTLAFSEDFLMWEIPELRKTFYCLFSSSTLVLLSDIYHIFYGFQDYGSYVLSRKYHFILFEMMTMLSCFTLFTVYHYGKITPIEFLRGYGRNAPLFGITGREYKPANLLQPKL